MSEPSIDLAFSLTSSSPIAADHGYHLYAAISRLLPKLHEPNGIAIHPIRGQNIGNREMQLCDWSRLTIRIDANRIAEVMPLAGKQLNLAGRMVRVGVPQVRPLAAATTLRSRLVIIKISTGVNGESSPPPNANTFAGALRRQVDYLGIASQAELHVGKRRSMRIKDKEIVGYEVLVTALTAEESLTLQEHGIGGRRHMGCGVFVPFNPRTEVPRDE